MKRSSLALLPLLLTLILIGGCGSSDSGPVVAKGYEPFTDEIMKFTVRHPTEWSKATAAGTAIFYSSSTLSEAFQRSFDPNGQTGAKIEVRAMLGGADAQKSSIDSLKATFTDASVIKSTEQVQLNGMPATKITYGFLVGNLEFKAERFYVVKETAVTYLETAVFGNYANYAGIFDSARASFKPAEVSKRSASPGDTSAAAVDLKAPPSEEMKSYGGSHFSISYPANFNPSTSSGGKLASMRFIGDRVDSYYQVDVFESTADLQQIVDANKQKFGSASPKSLGGTPAFVFNYSGGKDVASRVYFARAGNKLYQITVNWFKPQADVYLPAFEKALASFKAK
jgi:hypothetical protein